MTAAIQRGRRGVGAGRERAVAVRSDPAYTLLLSVIGLLNLISAVMVLSASSVNSITANGSVWFFAERQLMWITLAAGVFLVVARVDYRFWIRHKHTLAIVTGVLLVLVLIPSIGISVDGARRWLGTDSLRFQPSEAGKLVIVLLVASLLTRRVDEVANWKRVAGPAVAITAMFMVLLILQPDYDTLALTCLIVAAMLVAGGVPMKQIGVLAGAGASLGSLVLVLAPYRLRRVQSFLDPWKDRSNAGYQIVQSEIAIGSGGWTGVGLGASRAKWSYLPAAHTDFIFAIIAEELGLIGSMCVLGLIAALGVLGIRAAFRAPDRIGMLLAVGITTWFVVQALINICSVVGLIPVSGITLPFVSFGGSSLLITMGAAGVLANIARQGIDAPLPRGRGSLRPVPS